MSIAAQKSATMTQIYKMLCDYKLIICASTLFIVLLHKNEGNKCIIHVIF